MPIRDDVIFGPKSPSGQLTFGDVRKLNPADQMKALKDRLDAYLISQVSELGRDNENRTKVNSPFPLFLMSLVAMETLGKVFFHPKFGSKENAQRMGFMDVAKRIDTNFSRPLTSDEKKHYDSLWSEDERKNVSSKADILYKFGRHTMAHGYRGRGVYITGENSIGIWRMNQGAIELNPYLFWKRFIQVYEDTWEEFHKETEPTSPRTCSALSYLKELLND